MTVPNADDSPCNTTWGPNQDDDSFVKPASGNVARLAVIEAVVHTSQMSTGKDLFGSAHVEPALTKQCFSLLRIAGDTHVLIVATIKTRVKPNATRKAAV
jgi:hypothetical protein